MIIGLFAFATATQLEGDKDGGTSPPRLMFTPSPPPHDPAVVTSVLKYFLRSLPEPLLTVKSGASIEAVCDLPEDTKGGIRRRLVELVHLGSLPRPNRYLLAWLLQHLTHVMDRAEDNKMTLANLIIIFSPTLRMSHHLLALLLSQPSPEGQLKTNIAHI